MRITVWRPFEPLPAGEVENYGSVADPLAEPIFLLRRGSAGLFCVAGALAAGRPPLMRWQHTSQPDGRTWGRIVMTKSVIEQVLSLALREPSCCSACRTRQRGDASPRGLSRNTGSDVNGCSGVANACATFQHALTQTAAGGSTASRVGATCRCSEGDGA